MLGSNLKITYILDMKNLIKPINKMDFIICKDALVYGNEFPQFIKNCRVSI